MLRHTHTQRVSRRLHATPTLRLIALAAAAAPLLPTSVARAADGTWTNPNSGTLTYSDPANWLDLTPADGAGATANFATIDPLGDITVTLDSARTLGHLTFGDTDPTNTPASWIFPAGNTLTLAGADAPTINVSPLGTGKEVLIAASLAGTQGFIKNGAGTLHLTGANALTVTGATLNAGTVILGSGNSAGSNSISNPLGAAGTTVTLNGGNITNGLGGNPTVTLQNNFAVNANTTIVMGGRMVIGQGATSRTVTLNNNANLTLTLGTTVSRDDISANFANGVGSTGTVTFNGSGTTRLFINGGSFGAGFTNINVVVEGSAFLNPQTNSGGNTINVGSLSGSSVTAGLAGGSAGSPNYSVGALNTSTTFAGGISGNAVLTKVGSGTLVLTNNTGGLSSTANTNVNAGVLQIDGTKSGTGNTVVNTGGTLAGTGTISNSTVTVNAGGHIAPGASLGTLSVSNLILQPGSFFDAEFSASSNDFLNVPGTLTINGGGVNLFNEAGTTPFSTNGVYNLIQYGGIAGLGVGGLGIANPQPGKIYDFDTVGNVITLTISSAGAPVYWNKTTGGTWAANGNWTGSFPNATGAFAGFGGGGTPIAGPATVTLDGDKTVGTVSFNSANSFTVSQGTSGSIVLDNGSSNAAITNAAGNHTVSAPVSLSTVGNDVNVVSASDSLTLSGPLSGAGAVTKVGAGTLVLAGASPNYTGTFSAAAGTAHLTNADALQSATLIGGAGTLTTNLPSLNVGRLGAGTINFGSAVQLPLLADHSTATFAGSLTGPATIVKQGGGYLYLTGNNAHTGGIVVNGGILNIAAAQSYTGNTTLNNAATLELAPGAALGGDVIVSGNSAIYLLPTGLSGSASIFPGFNTVLQPGVTATVNSSGLGNGLGGTVSGDASSTLVVQGQTSYSAQSTSANPKQFQGMLGTVRVDGTLRFSGTNPNNGGDNTTFDLNGGTLGTRNGGPISLGALTGTGTLSQGLSADGNSTYTVGLKGNSTTFAGQLTDAVNRQNNLVKAGAGTLTITGFDNRTNGSSFTANGGTLVLVSPSAYNNVLNVAGNFAAVGTAGTLVFDYTNNADLAPTILSLLQTSAASSYSSGQLRSAPADSLHGILMTTNAANSTVTLTGAILGDLNLDGQLNADDYALIDRGAARGLTGWSNGDLNYDNTVNATDYLMLDSTFLALTSPPAAAIAALVATREAQFGSEYSAALLASVPEPTTLSLIAFSALPLLSRRRRHR